MLVSKILPFIKQHKYIACLAIFFGFFYANISLVNHYLFRTFALDLGAYTNALYDYSHLQFNDSTVFKEVKENLLADHFDLLLVILSPLSYIFKTYTLLVVQIAALVSGGIGVYNYFLFKSNDKKIAIAASFYFYTFFGIFAALSFDYHSNVIATMLVPWFFYFLKKQQLKWAGLMLLFVIISKENMALWATFICLGLMLENYKNKNNLYFLISATTFSALYFLVVTKFVMPSFSNNNSYPHFHYSVLGNNYFEAIKTIFSSPLKTLKILFVNHNGDTMGFYVKAELHILLLLTGLPLLFYRPAFLIMLIPIYFQKLFHDWVNMWGIYAQYSIEFAPIITLGAFGVISEINKKSLQIILVLTLIIMSIGCDYWLNCRAILPIDENRNNIFKQAHYLSNYDGYVVYNQLSKIPSNARVSCQSNYLPHLALRDNIYQFPIINDAEYIVYTFQESSYPLHEPDFKKLTKELEHSNDWQIFFKSTELTILKKVVHQKNDK